MALTTAFKRSLAVPLAFVAALGTSIPVFGQGAEEAPASGARADFANNAASVAAPKPRPEQVSAGVQYWDLRSIDNEELVRTTAYRYEEKFGGVVIFALNESDPVVDSAKTALSVIADGGRNRVMVIRATEEGSPGGLYILQNWRAVNAVPNASADPGGELRVIKTVRETFPGINAASHPDAPAGEQLSKNSPN